MSIYDSFSNVFLLDTTLFHTNSISTTTTETTTFPTNYNNLFAVSSDICIVCNTSIDDQPYYQIFGFDQKVHSACNDYFMVPSNIPPTLETPSPVSPNSSSSSQFTSCTMLADYQVANYNLYPNLAISLGSCCEKRAQAEISLVMVADGKFNVIPKGIQSGGEKWIEVGKKHASFQGLKFAKMRVIKQEIKKMSSGTKRANEFKLMISINNTHHYTNSFKLVSACTQIPEDIRETVRPAGTIKKKKSSSPVKSIKNEGHLSHLAQDDHSLSHDIPIFEFIPISV